MVFRSQHYAASGYWTVPRRRWSPKRFEVVAASNGRLARLGDDDPARLHEQAAETPLDVRVELP